MELTTENCQWIEKQLRQSEDPALRELSEQPLPGCAILARLIAPHSDLKTGIRYLRSGKSGAGVLLLLPQNNLAKVVKFGPKELIAREFHNFNSVIRQSLLWSLTEFVNDEALIQVEESWASFAYRWVGGRYNVQQVLDLIVRSDINVSDITHPVEELIACAFAWYKDQGLVSDVKPPSFSWNWSDGAKNNLLSILQGYPAQCQELIRFVSDPFDSVLHEVGNAKFSLAGHTHGDVNFRNVAFFGQKQSRLNCCLIDFERLTGEACPARDWAKLERDLRFKCLRAIFPDPHRCVEMMKSINNCLEGGTLPSLDGIEVQERSNILKILGTISAIRSAYIFESEHFSDLPFTEYLWLLLYWWLALLIDTTIELDEATQSGIVEISRTLLSQLRQSILDKKLKEIPKSLLTLLNDAEDMKAPLSSAQSSVALNSLLPEFLADSCIAAQLAAPFGTRAVYLDDVYVHRTEIEKAILTFVSDLLANQPISRGSWLSIIGDAGHGKTSILWYLARQLSDSGCQVVAVQALHLGVDSLAHVIEDLPDNDRPPIFLLDTLDLLIGVNDAALSAQLNAIRAKGGLLLTTCRRQEIQTLASFIRSNRTLELRRYEENEARAAIERYVDASYPDAPEAQRRAQAMGIWELLDARRRIQDLTFEPLLLRMIFEAYVPEKIPSDINTQRIYDHYWAQKVLWDRTSRGMEMADARSMTLKVLAHSLYFGSDTQTESITMEKLVTICKSTGQQAPHSVIESLVSTGVVRFWQMGATLGFFHQTFAEYAAAKAILESDDLNLRGCCIETLLSDVGNANLFRLPVLKQLMIQASDRSAQLFGELSTAVTAVDSPVSVRLALEVLGKASEVHPLHQLILNWCDRTPDLFRAAAPEVLRYYPAKRVALAFEILEVIANESICGEIFSICRLFFARMKPKETLAFVQRLWGKDQRMCSQYGDLLKDAVLEIFKTGEVEALHVLSDIFPRLSAGVQSGALDELGSAWSANTKSAAAEFVDGMLQRAASFKKNEVRAALARNFAAFYRIDPSAARVLAESCAAKYRGSPNLAARMFSARLLGTAGPSIDEVGHAIRSVLKGDHESRLCGSEFLRAAARELPEILDQFLALNPDEPLRREVVNGFYFVASGVHDPERMLAVLNRWPPTESGSGDAYRELIAGVADVDPIAVLSWLRSRKSDTEGTVGRRLILVGFQILAERAAEKLIREDFMEFFDWGFGNRSATDEERRVSACAVGYASEVDVELAQSYGDRIFATHRRDFINALLNSSRTVSSADFICYLLEKVREFSDWKLTSDTLGYFLQLVAWRSFEIRARLLAILVEPKFLSLIRRIDSPEVVSNLLTFLKSTVKADPMRVLRIIEECPILDSGNAATLAVVLENASRETDDPSVCREIFRRLLELSANPSDRLRNALLRAFPRIEALLPHREVVTAVVDTLISAKDWDEKAVEQLARSARKLRSLTREDRETLVRADLPPRAKVLLLE
ncbi:MAG: hypothetical protein JST28_09925 [Acidobacteria bacterium]|nr:hypothetical protein [Acidobacteriota bacterium]